MKAQRALKRALDLVVSASMLAALAPALLIIAIAVARTSPGGPLFRQARIGRGGRPFMITKFRTMTVPDPASVRTTGDPDYGESRITPVGRILRRWSLDELPQLFDVLRGEMSLVGPRPDLPHHVERYSALQRRRLQVRPGVTGLAQIMGRNEISWERRIRLDVVYVERWTLGMDVWIIVKTFGLVVLGRGTALPERR